MTCSPYAKAALSPTQVASIRHGLTLAAEQMANQDILDLADALHAMVRARRRRTDYHAVDARI